METTEGSTLASETRRQNKRRHALTLALIAMLMTSMSASVRAQEETVTTSGQWRYEYLKNAYFDGPAFGVWVEFDPATPHPFNAGAEEEDIRNSAVPHNPNYGFAAVRQIDLSMQWYYYDPTGYYGVTPTATVAGVPGHVAFEWSDPAHPYNSGTSVPEEAREHPYPYGVSLTNENGEVLEWTTEGTTYDVAATQVEETLDAAGIPISRPGASSGNVFQDALNQATGYMGDFWSFLGWAIGIDLGEAPWQDFLDSIGSGEGIGQTQEE